MSGIGDEMKDVYVYACVLLNDALDYSDYEVLVMSENMTEGVHEYGSSV